MEFTTLFPSSFPSFPSFPATWLIPYLILDYYLRVSTVLIVSSLILMAYGTQLIISFLTLRNHYIIKETDNMRNKRSCNGGKDNINIIIRIAGGTGMVNNWCLLILDLVPSNYNG